MLVPRCRGTSVSATPCDRSARPSCGTRAILASAHLATQRFAQLAAAWAQGDVITARRWGHALAPVSAAAFAEPNPVVIKGALHVLGRIPTPQVRLPLLPAGTGSVTALLTCLAGLGAAGRLSAGQPRVAMMAAS